MVRFPFDIVAFDLDGTLLETHKDLGTAVNHALTLGGFLAVPVDSVKDLIGGGAKIMLRRAIDKQGGCEEGRFRELYKEMLAHYGDHFADHTRPYPHAVKTVQALRARGVRTAVLTNKFESFARGVLAAIEIDNLFDLVIGGDTLGPGRAKPAPDMVLEAQARLGGGRIAFIGDSSYDILCGKAAGCPTIAASYGYGDRTMPELGADAVIDSLDQLIPTLERL